MRSLLLIGMGIFLLVLPAYAIPTYSIATLPALSGELESQANALNDSGQATGYSYDSSGNYHAVLWSGETIQDLITLSGESQRGSVWN